MCPVSPDRKPLFVCKYLMSTGHWQIYDHGDGFDMLALEQAPKQARCPGRWDSQCPRWSGPAPKNGLTPAKIGVHFC